MRRRFLFLVLAVLGLVPGWSRGQNPGPANQVKISLKERLEKGLRAARPVEFEFIAEVVDRVEAGELPQALVDRAFQYAREKPEHRVVYFQRVLRALAARLGYTV